MDLNDPAFVTLASRASSRFDLWTSVLTAMGARTVLEVGVWRGEFAKTLLQQCPGIDRYFMIDPWTTLPDWNKPLNVDAESFADAYAATMRRTAFASGKRIVLRGRTSEVIDTIADNSLDVAYLDGDHTLRGITIDLISVFPKVKNGGLIAGDDFSSSPWQHDRRFEPTLVFPFSVHFAEAMNLPIVALPFNQFVIQKRPGVTFHFRDLTGTYGDVSLNRLLHDA